MLAYSPWLTASQEPSPSTTLGKLLSCLRGGLCLAFVGASSWESQGDRARGGSMTAKPFMVRGVAESPAHPSGRWCLLRGRCGWPHHPSSLFSFSPLTFQPPSSATPPSQQRTHGWLESSVASVAGSSLAAMGSTG